VPISYTSLHSSNVYILDHGHTIYQWNGSGTNRILKSKGLDLANRIRTKERGGKAKLIVLNQGKEDMLLSDDVAVGKVALASQQMHHEAQNVTPAAVRDFWQVLGGEPSQVKLAENGVESEEKKSFIMIYRYIEISLNLRN